MDAERGGRRPSTARRNDGALATKASDVPWSEAALALVGNAVEAAQEALAYP